MSYFDDTGLFWVTEARALRGGPREDPLIALRRRLSGMSFDQAYTVPELRAPPPGPVALDLETEDPDMMKRGPSWAFAGRGKILGFAVAWEGFEAYYPIGHREGNVDPGPVLRWVTDLLRREDVTIVCANAVYDLGWCRRELGLYPRGGQVDVQFMAALLDEYRLSYSLDSLSHAYLRIGKNTGDLEEIERKLGIRHGELMATLAYLPAAVVAPYAATDARRTWDLYAKLMPQIQAQGLSCVHDLESRLIPMSTEMRRIGIKVDVDRAAALSSEIRDMRLPGIRDELKRLTGVAVEPWEAESCEAALATIGVKCERTRDGSPKVDAAMLADVAKVNPVGTHILAMRKMSKVQGTFLEGHILRHQESGRVHAEFNQLRSEREENGFGTVTGRYSATNPGLQQLPTRDPEWGPLVRGLFLPEEGEVLASLDYASQEPRLAIHFAYLAKVPGAAEAIEVYRANPNTDYHQYVANLCGIPRPQAKTINLGLAYGMGGAKLAHSLHLPTVWKRIVVHNGRNLWQDIAAEEVSTSREQGYSVVEVAGPEAAAIIKQWEDGAPFVRGLFKKCVEVAQRRGFIMTLLKRRCRFPEEADGSFGYAHKAMNRLCQSSAADQTKSGMLALWDAGIVPRLTIHDELLFSVPNEAAARELVPYMVGAAQLEVPSVVDVKCGATWGAIKK